MFRSRRGALVKRLWKTRLRATTTTTETDTPQGPTGPGAGGTRGGGDGGCCCCTANASAGGCYEYCGIGRPPPVVVESGDRSGDDEGGTEDESSSSSSSLLSKTQVFAFLDQLDVGQLEGLLSAVRTGADEATACVMVASDVRLSGSLAGVPPALVCGLLWRWPTANPDQLRLRRLPFCGCTDSECFATGSSVDSRDGGGRRNSNVYVCCNPYHWSIRTLPDAEVSSVYYTNLIRRCSGKTKSGGGGFDSFTLSSESGFSVTSGACTTSYDAQSSHGSRWCTVAYWELRRRVGRLYAVDRDCVDVFQRLPHGYGLCLASVQPESSDARVRRARDKIGRGVVLSREPDGVWVYNRSTHPVFVNHLAAVTPARRTTRIQRLPPGCSLRVFDHAWHELLRRTRDAATCDGPSNPYCAQVSFAKGWGPSYSRQTVFQCPCWIEILLHVNR